MSTMFGAEMIKILHIDDNPDDLELSKLLFEHLSDEVNVSVASTAAEALVSITDREYDCIICDYNLPDVDGLSLLQNLRQAGDTTPFIFLTGEGDEEVAATALRSGADDYYVKKTGTGYYRILLARIKKLNEAKRAKREAELEKAQQSGEHFLFHALDSLREAVFVLDEEDNRIVYCNSAVQRLFGFSRDELINGSMEQLVLSKIVFHDLISNISRRASGEAVEHIQLSMRTKDNDIIISDVTTTRYADRNGEKAGLVLVARDDSRNRVREMALRDHSADLEQRLEELGNIKKEFETFIHTVSHDLKGHVNNIVEFSKIIENDYNTLDQEHLHKYIGIINRTGQNLKVMLEGLSGLSRANSAKLEMREVNMSTVAQNLIRELRDREPERNVKVTIEPDMYVFGDEGLLHSAISNLLNNAWKYTSDCDLAEITFSHMDEGGRRIYFVEDNGIGFDESEKDQLFKPFKRLSSAETIPGTGLGLSIVERVIHRHGGSVWAESEVGEGTSFFFTLS